ncbi:MAG: hypothetical protein HYY02_12080 [Chloroflexi bacterium]|nr:hypothetical protein [Chloroflexota bacterium]
MTGKARWTVIILILTALPFSACMAGGQSQAGLPGYAYRSEAALQGYRTANEHRALLRRMPCYCGCGQDPQYTSLESCFFSPQGGFNAHAANCAVCLEEAEDAAGWRREGMTLVQIRQAIASKYQERGPATQTPAISPGEEVDP